MPRKEHGENYSSQLTAPVVSTTSPLLLKCILHAQRQPEMVLPWSNIHNLVKIVPHLVVRSACWSSGAYPRFPFSWSGFPPTELIDTQIHQYQLVEQNSSNLQHCAKRPPLTNIVLLTAVSPFAICGAAKVKVYFLDIFPKLQVGLENQVLVLVLVQDDEDGSGASWDD